MEGRVRGEHAEPFVQASWARRVGGFAGGAALVTLPSLLVVLILFARPGAGSHAAALTAAGAAATMILASVAAWRFARRQAGLEIQLEAYSRHVARMARSAGLGTIASSIAHDLNNPLAVINEEAGWTLDVLERDAVDQQAVRHEIASSAAQILQQVKRASQFTRRVLNWTREADDRATEADVNLLLTRCAALLESDFRDAGVSLVCELASPLPPVAGNEAELGQVFLNLMKNAVDAMNGGGRLTVATAVAGDMVTVRVSDTGPGIPRELLGRIFEPFFTTKAAAGTGLGLAISRWTVRRAGGDICVVSTPGAGSTFQIRLVARKGRAS